MLREQLHHFKLWLLDYTAAKRCAGLVDSPTSNGSVAPSKMRTAGRILNALATGPETVFCELNRSRFMHQFQLLVMALLLMGPQTISAGDAILAAPGKFHQLTEPPCSYCSNQQRKGLIRADDPVIAWVRGAHNGGAIPLRHFLAAPRVINDTYGLFFYDPDGGYVSAFSKDYGYEFYGWRRGVMIVRGKDGTLWSALSGRAIEGPQTGRRLERLPSFPTQWGYWLMLHPESTAYDLFDGQRYPLTELPQSMAPEAKQTMALPDPRLDPLKPVLGVELDGRGKAFPLDETAERKCWLDSVGGTDIAVLWYGPTRSAIAFDRRLGDRVLTLYADTISPKTAPFKDKETGTRWTLAGRAVDGPLRGQELKWVPSIECRWYAWTAEYPQTALFSAEKH